jgi:hypothetical protein
MAKKFTEDFVNDLITWDKDIPSDPMLRMLAAKKRHPILVSNVKNPKKIQIQLIENQRALNELMDEMENVIILVLFKCEAIFKYILNLINTFY